MTFLDRVYERARKLKARIVLAEGEDARVQEAARRIEREGLGTVDLLDQATPDAARPTLISLLRTRRPDKFPTDAAASQALEHPLTFGACLVGLGEADVMLGGAMYTSAETIRAALAAVGTAPDIAPGSRALYIIKDDPRLTLSHGARTPETTPPQLAGIALASE